MKKIITILIFVAACGLLLSSVSAADLQEHDFDGHFSLDVPVNAFYKDANAEGQKYTSNDGQGLTIQYLTTDDLNGASFEDYVNSLGLKDGKIDGNFTVFQDGDKYVVIVNSTDEMYIITDKNLDEAKAIAESADLESSDATPAQDTSETSNASSDVDLEEVAVGDVLTIDAPKGSEFDNGSYYDGFWTVFYSPDENVHIFYASDDAINEESYKEYVDNFTKSNKGTLSEDGNISVVDSIQLIDGTHEVFINEGNQIVGIISNDLTLSKEMAHSVEFTK